jgi:hypothetical protein
MSGLSTCCCLRTRRERARLLWELDAAAAGEAYDVNLSAHPPES